MNIMSDLAYAVEKLYHGMWVEIAMNELDDDLYSFEWACDDTPEGTLFAKIMQKCELIKPEIKQLGMRPIDIERTARVYNCPDADWTTKFFVEPKYISKEWLRFKYDAQRGKCSIVDCTIPLANSVEYNAVMMENTLRMFGNNHDPLAISTTPTLVCWKHCSEYSRVIEPIDDDSYKICETFLTIDRIPAYADNVLTKDTRGESGHEI